MQVTSRPELGLRFISRDYPGTPDASTPRQSTAVTRYNPIREETYKTRFVQFALLFLVNIFDMLTDVAKIYRQPHFLKVQ